MDPDAAYRMAHWGRSPTPGLIYVHDKGAGNPTHQTGFDSGWSFSKRVKKVRRTHQRKRSCVSTVGDDYVEAQRLRVASGFTGRLSEMTNLTSMYGSVTLD